MNQQNCSNIYSSNNAISLSLRRQIAFGGIHMESIEKLEKGLKRLQSEERNWDVHEAIPEETIDFEPVDEERMS